MDIKALVQEQKSFFQNGLTAKADFRKYSLVRLKKSIEDYEEDILEALKLDLGKSKTEAYMTELATVYGEIEYFRRNIKKLMKVKRSNFSPATFPSKGRIYSEGYGSVLIMSPWNYPFQLAIMPLIGAIAGGNCAVVKPSAYAAHTSKIVKKIIETTFDEEYVACVTGGREENSMLLEEPFDYIFFTGGAEVGREVLRKAAENIIPVTLELGGKSPVIVEKTADVDIAARRIVWGKYLNCGQTCVAPDYVLVDKSLKDEFVKKSISYIEAMYGSDPIKSKNYGKIVNSKHLLRLEDNLKGQSILYGGSFDMEAGKLEPTIVDEPDLSSRLMSEEIFGPIMPIIAYENIEEAYKIISRRPKPLALYMFTGNKKAAEEVISKLQFGGGCINDTIMHLATDMPFGGVGNSGMGAYHGKKSYDTFTREKSILVKGSSLDVPFRYSVDKSAKPGSLGLKLMRALGDERRLKIIRCLMK